MKKEKLTIPELLDAIDYLKNMHSSSDNIHTYFKSGVHKLIYLEMNKFSKKELEEAHDLKSHGWNMKEPGCLYHLTLRTVRNPLLFSVLLSKGAFQSKLTKESKWVLKNISQPSLDLYERLYELETCENSKKNSGPSYHHPYSHLNLLLNFAIKKDTPEKIDLFDKIIKDFLDNNSEEMIQYAYSNIRHKKESAMSILEKCRERNIDVEKKLSFR